MKREKKQRRHRSAPSRPSQSQDDLLYGRQPIREMLRANRRSVRKLYLAESLRQTEETDEILRLAEKRGIRPSPLAADGFGELLGDVNHQGVAASVASYEYASLSTVIAAVRNATAPPALLLVLDHLEDPQNVGSLMRTAEAAGVKGVIIPERRAVGITPAVVRASAGAAEHMHVVRVTNLVRTMETLKTEGVWFAGLDGGASSQPYDTTDLTGPMALVIGSEGRGMKRLVREHCDYVIRLPMHGQVSSLNAAVSGAIALYEILRQRSSAAT